MKKIIDFLIRYYNKGHAIKIHIREATEYRIRKVSNLAINQMEDESPAFLENIILEKQFDIRSALMDSAFKDGCFTETVEKRRGENELVLTTKIRLYEN